jgi:phage-related protein
MEEEMQGIWIKPLYDDGLTIEDRKEKIRLLVEENNNILDEIVKDSIYHEQQNKDLQAKLDEIREYIKEDVNKPFRQIKPQSGYDLLQILDKKEVE